MVSVLLVSVVIWKWLMMSLVLGSSLGVWIVEV